MPVSRVVDEHPLTWKSVIASLMPKDDSVEMSPTQVSILRTVLEHAATVIATEDFLTLCQTAWANRPFAFFLSALELCVQTRNSRQIQAALTASHSDVFAELTNML